MESAAPSNEVRWDLIVVGAGPAGTSAAIAAARLGCKTLLVDAKTFPRRKVCGGCLNLVSLSHVRHLLGAEHPVWSQACPVASYHLLHRKHHFRYHLPGGLAIDREALDQALVDVAVDLGVAFCAPVTASVASSDRDNTDKDAADQDVACVELTMQNRSLGKFHAAAVVVAGGLGCKAIKDFPALRSRVAAGSRVGIAATISETPAAFGEPGIYMAVGDEGYVGLTQVSGGRLHLAAAVDRSALQRFGPQLLVKRVLDAAGAPEFDLSHMHAWRGTPPLTARPDRVATNRIFLVGDAAGYVEPFTGEGLRWALASGMEVAQYALRCQTQAPAEVAAAWEAWYQQTIRRSQRRCRQIAWGLRSRGTRWMAHQLLSWRPQLATPIIHGLNE